MSALDDAVSLVADDLKTTWGADARSELAALRARLAAAEAPKTCATCVFCIERNYLGTAYNCTNVDNPEIGVIYLPDDFGCIHHVPKEPTR